LSDTHMATGVEIKERIYKINYIEYYSIKKLIMILLNQINVLIIWNFNKFYTFPLSYKYINRIAYIIGMYTWNIVNKNIC
jgi:CRISPR/Cas system-associated protein Cas10 (large subunit of type III CRISPR-Cas system)